jgi:hypothetical protein
VFCPVGRTGSLIRKTTISAGYGVRMAFVMQDIAQFDELRDKNTKSAGGLGRRFKSFRDRFNKVGAMHRLPTKFWSRSAFRTEGVSIRVWRTAFRT